MKKHPLKSKTVNSALVVIVMVCLSLLGVGEKKMGETYDTITDTTGQTTAVSKDLITLIAAGGAIYGRFKVKEADNEDSK